MTVFPTFQKLAFKTISVHISSDGNINSLTQIDASFVEFVLDESEFDASGMLVSKD